jgi:Ala-tRNA(Pro) deacylase
VAVLIHNSEIAFALDEIADVLEIEGANPFRIRAYRNAARLIGGFGRRITDMVRSGEDLTNLPGIGADPAGGPPRSSGNAVSLLSAHSVEYGAKIFFEDEGSKNERRTGMAIAATVERFLAEQAIPCEIVPHRHTGDSLHTAEAAHVSGESVAKAVVLKDEQGYIVAVLPATYKLKIGELHAFTGRRHLELVPEEELGRLFGDCELGAVPALAAAYGVEAVWDESLALSSTLYFEGGITNRSSRSAARTFAK